jgi:hypothetical protein
MILSTLTGAAALGLAAFGGPAEASVVIDVSEVGGNVVVKGGGTVDLTGLSFHAEGSVESGMIPSFGGINAGSFGSTDFYQGATGPASFGPGGLSFASSSSGDAFGVDALGFTVPTIIVPAGYASGTALSGSETYDGQTFASLGLTPGTYAYDWGSGPTADSLTVKIGSIPEPATWAMMLLGFAPLGFAGFRATRKSAARAT